MTTPQLWCEARCGFIDDAPANKFGGVDCRATAPGEFGSRNAARSARAAGWKVLDGEWACPRCYKRLKESK